MNNVVCGRNGGKLTGKMMGEIDEEMMGKVTESRRVRSGKGPGGAIE